MKILVMDDKADKLEQIAKVLTDMCGLQEGEIDTARSLAGGRSFLFKNTYDLLVLDLVLPAYDGGQPEAEKSRKFIDEFERFSRIKKPIVIIGMTEYDEEFKEMQAIYSQKLWDLIQYSQHSIDWMETLQRAVQKVIDIRTSLISSLQGRHQFDVGIICALGEEYDQMERAFGYQWQDMEAAPAVDMQFKTLEIINVKGETIRMVSCCCNHCGMSVTASAASFLYSFFDVKEIYMTGFCAGFINKTEYGDLVIAKSEWDYGSAKIAEENGNPVSYPAPFMLPCSNAIIASVEAFIREKDPEHELLAELNEEHFKVDKFQIHVKNGACGSYVVANQDVMTDLLGHDRNLRTLDMEGYGLYTASYVLGGDRTALMIKAVADLGDKDKGDLYHEQCSFTSALFLREFLKYRFAIQEKPIS